MESGLKFSLQGAHIYHWQPSNCAQPILFCSEKALFEKGKAIRGGVPICWPWFGPKDDKGQHGFARISDWILLSDIDHDDSRILEFQLLPNEFSQKLFPNNYEVIYKVVETIDSLEMSLFTTNNGDIPFEISPALHSYFHVNNVKEIEISGLNEKEYIDKVDNGKMHKQVTSLAVVKEVDRIYLNCNNTKIIDKNFLRSIDIQQTSSSTVVWNPWKEKAKAMTDMVDDEYLKFVCVEAAFTPEEVRLWPGDTHTIRQKIVFNLDKD